MDTNTIQTIIIITVQLIVGGILWQQIRTQKQIINHYKGIIESASNIKMLHDTEIEQLKKTTNFDKEQVQKQVLELGRYVDNYLTNLYSYYTPDSIDRETHINRNMPNCAKLLESIHNYFHSKTPNA